MSRSQPNLLEDVKNFKPCESIVTYCKDFIDFPISNNRNIDNKTLCDDLSGSFDIETVRLSLDIKG